MLCMIFPKFHRTPANTSLDETFYNACIVLISKLIWTFTSWELTSKSRTEWEVTVYKYNTAVHM